MENKKEMIIVLLAFALFFTSMTMIALLVQDKIEIRDDLRQEAFNNGTLYGQEVMIVNFLQKGVQDCVIPINYANQQHNLLYYSKECLEKYG